MNLPPFLQKLPPAVRRLLPRKSDKPLATKQRVVFIASILALISAAVIAVVLVVGRDGRSFEDRPGIAGSTSADGQQPGAKPSAGASASAKPGSLAASEIPKELVNPLSGKTYCQTAKLLAIYSAQGYGLDRTGQVVDGKKFGARLKAIAATYNRLSVQAKGQKGAEGSASSWKKLSDATAASEAKLRVAGLQVDSQVMIIELATMGKVGREELPKATSTLQATCKLSPAIFGL